MPFHFDPSSDEYDKTSSKYLDVGTHPCVQIVDHDLNPGEWLSLTFEAPSGAQHEERFYLKPSVLWRLATVFKAVGFTSKIDLEASGAIKKALYKKNVEIVLEMNTNPNTGKAHRRIKYVNACKNGGGSGGRHTRSTWEDPPSSPDDEEPPF